MPDVIAPSGQSAQEEEGGGFRNIDVLPLGKLLRTKYLGGSKLGKRRKKSLFDRVREKGPNSK